MFSFLAHAHALGGRVDVALPLFEESLELAARVKFLPCNSLWIVWWGEAHLQVGQIDDAMDRAVRALELARAQKEPGFEAYALRLIGEISAQRHPAAAEPAERRYREALALAEPLGMRPLVARCLLGLGALARAAGNQREAEQSLHTATSMFREMGMPLWLAKAEAETVAL